jgi:hypothetical protein
MLRQRHSQNCIRRGILGNTRALQSVVIKDFIVVNFG